MADTYKQVIIIRNDLKLPKGKLAGQVAHAAVEAVMKTSHEIVSSWRSEGQKKIVLKVDSEKELRTYLIEANNMGITTALISDAGRTCIAPGTVTALGLGPDEEDKLDEIISELKLL